MPAGLGDMQTSPAHRYLMEEHSARFLKSTRGSRIAPQPPAWLAGQDAPEIPLFN